MNKKKRSYLSVATLVGALTLLLAGCAPAAQPAPPAPLPVATIAPPPAAIGTPSAPGAAPPLPTIAPPAPAPPGVRPPTAATPAPAPAARYGGVLTVGLYQSQKDLDPHTTNYPYTIFEYTGSGLLQMDPETWGPVPDLAESWENPKPTTWVFRLRKNVAFHDLPPVKGRKLTASDVVYSLNRLRTDKPEFRRRGWFEDIVSIEAPDEGSVVITTKTALPALANYLASVWFKVVPQEAVKGFGDLKQCKAAIGTGPFVLRECTVSGGVAVKNPNYFIPGRPYLDEVRWLYIDDEATRVAAVATGRVDVAHALASTQTRNLLGKKADYIVKPDSSLALASLLFQVDRKPYDDVRVRRALNLLIDRQEVIANAWDDAGSIGAQIPPQLVLWTVPMEELAKMPGFRQPKDQDIAEAKRLLTEAGYASGFPITFDLAPNSAWINQYPGEVIVPRLRKYGFRVTVRQMEPTAYISAEIEGNFEIRVRAASGIPEPDIFMTESYHSKGSRNYSRVKDPKLDAMIEAARRELDIPRRRAMYREIHQHIMDQAYRPGIGQARQYAVAQPYIHNLKNGSRALQHEFSDVWLSK